VQVACVIVTDARPGHHAVLDVDVIPSEGEADWLAFLRSLVERGVSGVTTVISDYHEGLEAAVPAAMPDALWLQSFSSPRTRLPA
jgi:transposase-like protein